MTRRAHHPAQVPGLSRDDILDLHRNRVILEEAALVTLAADATALVPALAVHRELLEYVRTDHRAVLAPTHAPISTSIANSCSSSATHASSN